MIGTPNVNPRAKCTNVVVQATRLIVWCRSSIFLPSQTRGNVNNTPPIMIDRFITFEIGAFNARDQKNQIIAKRATLTRNSMTCLIVPSSRTTFDSPLTPTPLPLFPLKL
jgi:hypothetical protein